MFNADLLEKTPELRTFVYHNFDRQPRAIMNEIARLNRRWGYLRPSLRMRLGMLCDLMIMKCTEYERAGQEYHRVDPYPWGASGEAIGDYWHTEDIKNHCWNMLERHSFVTMV